MARMKGVTRLSKQLGHEFCKDNYGAAFLPTLSAFDVLLFLTSVILHCYSHVTPHICGHVQAIVAFLCSSWSWSKRCPATLSLLIMCCSAWQQIFEMIQWLVSLGTISGKCHHADARDGKRMKSPAELEHEREGTCRAAFLMTDLLKEDPFSQHLAGLPAQADLPRHDDLGAVLCCAVLCCAVLCCAVPCRAVPCRAVLCRAVPCRAVLCCAVLCCDVLCCACFTMQSDILTQLCNPFFSFSSKCVLSFLAVCRDIVP